MKIKIVKWFNQDVIYESEKETIREVVIEAIKKGADLKGANLKGANLKGANLESANLYHALFYGRGGKTRIKKSQIAEFHKALGIIVEED